MMEIRAAVLLLFFFRWMHCYHGPSLPSPQLDFINIIVFHQWKSLSAQLYTFSKRRAVALKTVIYSYPVLMTSNATFARKKPQRTALSLKNSGWSPQFYLSGSEMLNHSTSFKWLKVACNIQNANIFPLTFEKLITGLDRLADTRKNWYSRIENCGHRSSSRTNETMW